MVRDGTRLVLVGPVEDLRIPLEDFEDRTVLLLADENEKEWAYLDNSRVPNLEGRMAFLSTTH